MKLLRLFPAVAIVFGALLVAPAASADEPPPTPEPLTVSIRQRAVSYDPATNKETVSVDLVLAGQAPPVHYDVAVRGTVVRSGDSSSSPITVTVTNNCSITTQSVTAAIADAAGATASAAATLDHSLCPPPPDVPHAQDRILAGPTLTRASFVDRLRAVGSPALPEGAAIYDTLVAGGVNPAFALGMFHAESHSGTRGYAQVTLNWGNILYYAWEIPYGATPYAPGNGYTYAMYPTWLDSVRAMVDLLRRYDASGYVTVSQASAHWLGTKEGTDRHLTYLNNITKIMSLLPDDAVPVMTSLTVPAAARATFTATWTAKDNLAVTGYQVRVRRGTDAWSAPEAQAESSRTFTLAGGTWTIGVRATDSAGNWSPWRKATVVVDAAAPVMRSLVAPHVARAADAVVDASWSASDNRGVTGYEIRTRKGTTGEWSAITKQKAASLSRKLSPGAWYLAVRARDAVGNRSEWREALVIVPTDDRAYSFSTGMVRATSSHYYRGTATRTAREGSRMTIRFTGSAFYLVGTAAPSYGRLRVTIDGVSATVDAGTYHGKRATKAHYRVLLYSRALAAGEHTAVITNLATASRPWIAVDGVGFGP